MARLSADIMSLVRRYSAMVEQANGTLAKVLAAEGAQIEAAMVRALAKDRALTVAEAEEIRSVLRRIVARQSQGDRFLRLASETVPDVAQIGVARVMASGQRLLGPGPRLERILRVSRLMDERLASQRLIATEFYAKRWADAWRFDWTRRANAIADALREAAVRGDGWKATAKAIEGQLSGLKESLPLTTPSGRVLAGPGTRPIAGYVHRTPFARGFARTIGTDVYNRAAIEAGAEVGFDLLVNIGIPDERQSEICYAASNESPMTAEAWSRWRRNDDPSIDGGKPPRHVFNCRCALHPIPREAANQDWSQPNPARELEGVA